MNSGIMESWNIGRLWKTVGDGEIVQVEKAGIVESWNIGMMEKLEDRIQESALRAFS
jgi:hypothetical protein